MQPTLNKEGIEGRKMPRFIIVVDTKQKPLEAAVNQLNNHPGLKVVSVMDMFDTVIVEAAGAYTQITKASYPWMTSCSKEQEVVAF